MSKFREFLLEPIETETGDILKNRTEFRSFHDYEDYESFPKEMPMIEKGAYTELQAQCGKLVEALKDIAHKGVDFGYGVHTCDEIKVSRDVLETYEEFLKEIK